MSMHVRALGQKLRKCSLPSLPPGRFFTHSIVDCGFSINACAVLCRVMMNHDREFTCTSARLPILAGKADLFLARVNSVISHTLAQSRVREITLKPVARLADVRVQQRAERKPITDPGQSPRPLARPRSPPGGQSRLRVARGDMG